MSPLRRPLCSKASTQPSRTPMLAEALGLSEKTVGHYEVGRIRLQVSILPELADCLGVSISALLDPLRKTLARRKPGRHAPKHAG